MAPPSMLIRSKFLTRLFAVVLCAPITLSRQIMRGAAPNENAGQSNRHAARFCSFSNLHGRDGHVAAVEHYNSNALDGVGMVDRVNRLYLPRYDPYRWTDCLRSLRFCGCLLLYWRRIQLAGSGASS